MLALSLELHERLKSASNLLAFSAGSDSSALFYLLLTSDISFDLAMVDYQVRPESKQEVEHAQKLAQQHGKRLHLKTAPLEFSSNFEHMARQIRYEYFESLIQKGGYDHLLLGHQLNDRLEWLLMQLSKGAGAAELVGFHEIDERENYQIIRPLIRYSKQEIESYLKQRGVLWFHDRSNEDMRFTRNRFREQFATPLLEEFVSGIKRSFELLEEDEKVLMGNVQCHWVNKLCLFAPHEDKRVNLRLIDRACKQLGVLLSFKQREEIETVRDGVVAGKVAVVWGDSSVWIAPYVQPEAMEKAFKEACRLGGIPPKIRGYLYESGEKIEKIAEMLKQLR